MKNDCLQCGNSFEITHYNQKYCCECVILRRKKSFGLPSKLSLKQKETIMELCGKKDINEIAKEVGISRSGVKRVGNYLGLKFGITKYSNELKEKVTRFYEIHGKPKTKKEFPDVKVKSIIERYGKGRHKRCRPWKDSELIELVKMAGIVSFKEQWKVFNRPRAFAGSIRSAWVKKFKVAPRYINGLYRNKALYIANENCPFIETGHYNNSKLYLWVDLENNLKEGVSMDFKKAIEAMANFQRWLWGKDNVREEVLKMVSYETTK